MHTESATTQIVLQNILKLAMYSKRMCRYIQIIIPRILSYSYWLVLPRTRILFYLLVVIKQICAHSTRIFTAYRKIATRTRRAN